MNSKYPQIRRARNSVYGQTQPPPHTLTNANVPPPAPPKVAAKPATGSSAKLPVVPTEEAVNAEAPGMPVLPTKSEPPAPTTEPTAEKAAETPGSSNKKNARK